MRRAAVALAMMLLARPARGDHAPCRSLFTSEDLPRGFEGSYFVSAGVASNNAGTRPAVLGVGLELTRALLHWTGFPSGYGGHRSELRYGAWAHGATRPDTRANGGLVEGGAILDVSSPYHASWGTFTLRGGAGYGAFGDERDGFGVVTALYGVRSVLAHYSNDGACRGGRDPLGERALPEASVARVFGTYRRAFSHDGYELVFGLELSPTFFWPPLTWWRVAGGPPR